jgi:hypothetical protein
MAMTRATTVNEYLDGLAPERRAVVSAVRDVVRANLPRGYEEAAAYGMICYQIPLASYPDTYNGQPLCYAAIAAQKNHYAVYLMGVYGSEEIASWLADAFARAGKKLEKGKSCVRFKTLDALPLEVIGQVIARVPPDKYIEMHERVRAASQRARKRAAKTPAKKAAGKRTTGRVSTR